MRIEIRVSKYVTVNGKRVLKTFSSKLDPKAMAVYKTKGSLCKKIEAEVVKSGIFKREELKELEYDMKEFLVEWKKQVKVAKEEELARLEVSNNNPCSRITPDKITRLAANEVFVFGSNAQGLHYGGAAKDALEKFGAIKGRGEGMQGKSYAIISMSGLEVMGENVKRFCKFAKAHPEKRFLVTPIGCGIAGSSADEVAPLFEICRDVENITLPASFWNVIGAPPAKEYDLDRFVVAHARDYEKALNEIRSGQKTSHWIWYIFPQKKGLGYSVNSNYYGLEGIDEARAFLDHPILGEHLREISNALLLHAGKKDIDTIMRKHIDVTKLQTCMNLFNRVSPDDVFKKVLDTFF